MRNIGIYIHMPFCLKKCRYCDFYSIVSNDSLKSIYVDKVVWQLRDTISKYPDIVVDTVYIGGGTPSVMTTQMMQVLFDAVSMFELSKDCEITMEVNPGTVDADKIKKMKKMGVNRISMGVESMCDDELKVLGRLHNSNDVKSVNRLFRRNGVKNISMDLLFAFHSQSEESFKKTMTDTAAMKPAHISAYPLKIEDDTEFGRMLEQGQIEQYDEEIDRNMYHYMISFLKNKGYEHYEISSFAKKGFRSKHNLKYWDLSEYIGIGASAHSFIDDVRYKNQEDVYSFISDPLEKTQVTKYTEEELLKEYMMLGFRRIDGISKEGFFKRFKKDIFDVFDDQLNELIRRGLITTKEEQIFLTKIGLDYANQVFRAFL